VQVLGCSLENGHVRQHYGWGIYFITIYCLSVWYSLTLGSSTANPCSHLIRCVQGKTTLRSAVNSVFAQIIGAVVSWKTARMLWQLDLTASHRHRFHHSHYDVCQSDLTVSVAAGVAIESLACVMDCVLSLTTFMKNSGATIQLIEEHVKMLVLCAITAAGIWFDFNNFNVLDSGPTCKIPHSRATKLGENNSFRSVCALCG
jgi:glycerol uptake facilitator-like aquaporin